MKPLHLLFCCCGVLLAAVAAAAWRATAQSVNQHAQRQIPEPSSPALSTPGAPKPLLLNPKTWVLTEMDGTPIEGAINSREAILERYYANLAALNPQEYERIFPKSDATRRAIQDAVNAAHHPRSLEQRLNEIQDPGKRAEIEQSIHGILNPQPVTDEMRKRLDASPAGPWSNVMKP